MKSKLKRPEKICGYECHHVFNGANRSLSETYNCIIYLPPWVHAMVHKDAGMRRKLKAEYQKKLEKTGWTRGEFLETFGENYL